MSQPFTSPFDTAGPLDAGIIANPYPHYHQLRAQDPVHWNEGGQGWNLTRYADVLEALRDVGCGDDRDHARQAAGSADVDGTNAGMGVGTS